MLKGTVLTQHPRGPGNHPQNCKIQHLHTHTHARYGEKIKVCLILENTFLYLSTSCYHLPLRHTAENSFRGTQHISQVWRSGLEIQLELSNEFRGMHMLHREGRSMLGIQQWPDPGETTGWLEPRLRPNQRSLTQSPHGACLHQ